MADIQTNILEKYDIDIDKVNLFKLYKIENADISKEELDNKIEACLKRWQQSVNGPNERLAQRDKVHLDNASKYESILRNDKLRNQLYAYYHKAGDSAADISFAKEYFGLLHTTKKIRKKDVDFFFEYFAEERKNKKAIVEMLSKEFKVLGLNNKENNEKADDKDKEVEGKKDDGSIFVMNLFQEATLLKLCKCQEFFEAASKSDLIYQKFPAVQKTMFELLELEKTKQKDELAQKVAIWRKQAFDYRQEKGNEFIPIVDLFNTLTDVLEYRDVIDNFEEFKLLIKFPKLTPYMYRLDDVKKDTMNELLEIAKRYYRFRDMSDFILNYFLLMHDNFNIGTSAVKGMIKDAKKKETVNKVWNAIDKKLAVKKDRVPVAAAVMQFVILWPLYLFWFLSKMIQLIFVVLKKLTVPMFIVSFIGMVVFMAIFTNDQGLYVFRHIVNKNEWYTYLGSVNDMQVTNGFLALILTFKQLIWGLAWTGIPSFLVFYFLKFVSEEINKGYDWKGLDRTMQAVMDIIRDRTKSQYEKFKRRYYFKRLLPMASTLVCTLILGVICMLIPKGLAFLSEKTGYFYTAEKEEVPQEVESILQQEIPMEEEPMQTQECMDGDIFRVTANAANIREGASTEYAVITTVSEGEILNGTGNLQVTDAGTIWYEVFLDEAKQQRGWASQKVVEFVE
ncbi:MAG: hypothetical protein E7290_07010 [Lachnospiraceae bacterium]|nr:hypothetical protein [Lachnospiraceae bacterium]